LIIVPDVENYLSKFLPERDSLLLRLEEEAKKEGIPIIHLDSMQLINVILQWIKPKRIIELGTAIGYSTIWLARANPNAVIETIERKKVYVERAFFNIKEANLEKNIIVHFGDIFNILPNLEPADVIFLDAAKGQYQELLELSFTKLNEGGALLIDNILFRGFLANKEEVETKPMLNKIAKFNEKLAIDYRFLTSFVPIGDGLAICYKKGRF